MSSARKRRKHEPKEPEQDEQEQRQLMNLFLGTIRRYAGGWKDSVGGVVDPRSAWKIRYGVEVILFTVVLMFFCHLGARRQVTHKLRASGGVRRKYQRLFGVEDVPHGDTLNYVCQRVAVEQVQEVVCRVSEKLMQESAFQSYRLFGIYYLVVIDGSGVLVYPARHCPYCLTRQLSNGTTLYYHPVLEAKWVTANGYAFSLMTEFIENRDPQASKQDCELKAFYRLAARIKARFPLLDVCLLLDGLYAGGPTLSLCDKYHWKYVITLTDADLPSVNQEFEALLRLPPTTQRTLTTPKGFQQAYRWVNAIDYTDSDHQHHPLNVLECRETVPHRDASLTTKFKWITNFTLLSTNVATIANQAGRMRWKIENEGFNWQKHGGFALEHAFTHHQTAHQVFYLLLQLAVTFYQLIAFSPRLAQAFPHGLGALKNLAFRLLEAWRNLHLDDAALLALQFLPPDTS